MNNKTIDSCWVAKAIRLGEQSPELNEEIRVRKVASIAIVLLSTVAMLAIASLWSVFR